MGNTSWIAGDINVNAGSDASTVKVVPQDPEADRLLIGSLYWMDVIATDIETIEKVQMVLDLNNASQWALRGMTTAPGFSASYSIQEDDNIATITITRTGKNRSTGEAVLASFPVRTWESRLTEYPGYEDQTPATLVKRGIIWKKAIEIELQKGLITFVEGTAPSTTGTFGMKDVLVDTEIFFTNYTRKSVAGAQAWIDAKKAAGIGWHEHTATALEDKTATCSEIGYTNRTYCEECESVVTWGTVTPATGHTYAIDAADGLAKCTCGELLTGILDGIEYVDGVAMNGWVGNSYYRDGEKLTGVRKVSAPDGSGEFYYDFGENGVCENQSKFSGLFYDAEAEVYRYSYLGNITTGWQNIDGEHYYFRSSTQAAAVGSYKYGPVTYVFDETGRVTEGVWYVTDAGIQYFYGPTCYYMGWKTIDGKEYYFKDNYCYTGIRYVTGAAKADPVWYEFAEDGALIRRFDTTGLFEHEGKLYYLIDGVSQTGLQHIDGYYYYFTTSGLYAVTGDYKVRDTNGLLPEGVYTFGDDCRMVREGLIEVDGTVYYFENGTKCYAGLIQLDGDYYYIRSNFQPATGSFYVGFTNDLLPSGTYEFGADGKMLQGIVDKNGVLYHYLNGRLSCAGLIEIDGAYYYAKSNGQLAIGKYNVTRTNGLLPEGVYTFDDTGKIILDGLITINGVTYYYKNNEKYYAGLIQLDGDYYYIRSNFQPATGKYYVGYTNDLMSAGTYEFAADGKMLQGIVEKDGVLYHYLNGRVSCAGLIEIDGAYYYAKSNGQLAIGTYNVTRTIGLLPEGEYVFDSEGKLVQNGNGLVDVGGKLYYYENGEKCYAGLILLDGDFYYIRSNFQPATGKYYVAKTNGLLSSGTYEFGPDGKMLQGIVDKDGILYHYLNGRLSCAGLIEIDGAYYYAKSDGKLAIGSYNVTRSNGLMPAGYYVFDETGKMVP